MRCGGRSPASAAAIARPGASDRGTNQTGVRLYNERLVLSLIRLHGELPKADIARLTGLSAADHLDHHQPAHRRRPAAQGQAAARPHRPALGALFAQSRGRARLRPEGRPAQRRSLPHRFHRPHPQGPAQDLPLPDASSASGDFTTRRHRRDCSRRSSPTLAARIAGLGIGAPYEMWTWHEEIGAPSRRARRLAHRRHPRRDRRALPLAGLLRQRHHRRLRRRADVRHRRRLHRLPLCLHRLVHRRRPRAQRPPVPRPHAERRRARLDAGARHRGRAAARTAADERRLDLRARAQAHRAGPRRRASSGSRPTTGATISARRSTNGSRRSPTAVAYSIVAAIAVIDVETVIIDGAFPVRVRRRIIEQTRVALGRVNQQGLSPFVLVEGSIGNAARAMGGACLPLLANFTQDREVLFKEFEATRLARKSGQNARNGRFPVIDRQAAAPRLSGYCSRER